MIHEKSERCYKLFRQSLDLGKKIPEGNENHPSMSFT